MSRSAVVLAILVVQIVCAVFFLANILTSVTGFAPINWQFSELIELGAALGLMLGVGLGAVLLRRTLHQNRRMATRLRVASGAFMQVLDERFTAWGLTPAERDVALFAIKGLSTAEIARMRATSEGTVKAQTNAIYRKAGVTGRPQLLSLFIDDLMGEPFVAPAPAETMAEAG